MGAALLAISCGLAINNSLCLQHFTSGGENAQLKRVAPQEASGCKTLENKAGCRPWARSTVAEAFE